MARFDVFSAPPGDVGFVLVVQTEFLDHLHTRVIVPLLPPALVPAPTRDLNPIFTIGSAALLLGTQFINTIDRRLLKQPVGNLASERDAITRALDLLLTGF